MGAFEYTALDARGREKTGLLEGDAARQIRQQLREQGLTPLSVEAVQQREARSKRALFRRGISSTDLALITRQWATLVRSGMPIDETLSTVSRQTEKSRLKSMMAAVRSRVLEGHTLADALADFPHVFSELFRSTVAAGEQTGHLDVVLERLADYTESRQQLSQKMMLALIYPTLLTLVAIAVVILLLAYVVPQVVQVFDNIGQELPVLTRGLIASSEFLQSYGIAIFIVLLVVAVAFVYALRLYHVRFYFHRLLLVMPLIGRLVKGLETARFARTFSILVASGVPVLDGMRISSQVMNNLPMREAVEAAARRVREGSGIYLALESCGYFPPMTVHLIASGESSGNLEEMLERAAAAQEREMETLISGLMGLFEPLLILSMGGVVLVIVLAILLPIFDLNQLVK
ncbi:MAG: type II secretion system inner membrane protein GspF [Gammaproteobacteria bacterium]|nr:type II secretion system inner membrane protein GspF [Gammaproteobacteria bacterium]